uniref:DUF4795 domain-containing protein n=1 Tax=Knipowitschia caucasica TaxID=637954 RepID=A0AAV2KCL2_KNICA
MAEKDISLYDLLNLSISSPGQGAVNFRAMYALLNSILRQLDLREVTVSAEDFTPGESGAEAGREEEQSRGVSAGPREQEEKEAGKEAASGQENVEDAQKALDLICRTQKQTEQLLQTVKVLRHQQDKSAAAQAQSDTHLRSQRERLDALEEAMRHPQQDDCYVTWEEMKSALLTERQNLEQGLIQTLREESVRPPSASDTAPTLDSQTEEATDVPPLPNVPVSTEASALAPAPDTAPDPDPAPVPPLQSLSQKACGASMYQETMEALWNVGRLKQRCDWMEERLAVLDVEREREKEELQRLRDLIQRRDADGTFSALKKELEDQRVLVQSLMSDGDQFEELRDSEDRAEDSRDRAPGLDQDQEPDLSSEPKTHMDPDASPNIPPEQEPEQKPVLDQTLDPDPVPVAESDFIKELDPELDSLRGMLHQIMESLPSELNLQDGPEEEEQREEEEQEEKEEEQREEEQKGEWGQEDRNQESSFKHSVMSLSSRLGLLFQQHEQLQEAVTSLIQQQPSSWRDVQARREREEEAPESGLQGGGGPRKEATGRGLQESAPLMSSVQKAILQLQNECEKLSETTQCLHEDNQQKQTHIQELYKATKQLEEKKADRNMVEVEMRADKSALETKVSRVQFDSVTEQLSNMFHELLSKVSDQEQDVSKVMDKLSHEMDLKLNRMELESVKKQLEARWKNIQEQMKSEGGLEQDDAAVFRKQLVERFHCLSCDRPVLKQSPGPQLMTLPASPSLPPNRSLRPFTVYTLEQIRQHYKSLTPGTNSFTNKLSNCSRRIAQLEKSCANTSRRLENLREDQRGQNQERTDRGAEAVDYSLYSVSRSCGGSHTVTPFTQRHRNAIQPPSQQRAPQDPLGLSEEVDIVGLDGHIYKGRLNTSPNRDKDTKLPTITSRDGSCGSSGRPPSSRAPRAVSPGLRRPSPPSGSGSLARGWSVSPLGCVSQGSTVPD